MAEKSIVVELRGREKAASAILRQPWRSSHGVPPVDTHIYRHISVCHAAADVRRLVFDADAAADSFDPIIDVVHDDKARSLA